MTGAEGQRRKEAAAAAALEEVRPGMLLGLGSGTTAEAWLRLLARRLSEGELAEVRGVPTSQATARLARQLGVPLADLPPEGVDLAVDGMDEVDAGLNAIKGLGGALLREKVVAEAARRFVLIGGAEKRVTRLGERSRLPVEVLPFGRQRCCANLRSLQLEPRLRGEEHDPYLSDNGNAILDCRLPASAEVVDLAHELDAQPAVIGHGLFLGLADAAYLADDEGLQRLEREP